MHVAFFHAPLVGDVIAHRVALKEVAVVEEKRVGGLGPDVGDVGGGAGETYRVDRAVAVVIIGPDMHMEVGGFHDAQMRLPGGGTRGKRVKGDQAGAGGGGHERTAGHVGGYIAWHSRKLPEELFCFPP